jgi:surfactin synthase thioesterase subunit
LRVRRGTSHVTASPPPPEWRKRFSNPKAASLPGGHFFVDQFPDDVARTLSDFLDSIAAA